ncbi:MAG TPA: hypothetical protein VJ575_01560, partial [Pseudogulbenkiania sp.]|nr:hypothetical protein [Pseudogulbenkiania sp.]
CLSSEGLPFGRRSGQGVGAGLADRPRLCLFIQPERPGELFGSPCASASALRPEIVLLLVSQGMWATSWPALPLLHDPCQLEDSNRNGNILFLLCFF